MQLSCDIYQFYYFMGWKSVLSFVVKYVVINFSQLVSIVSASSDADVFTVWK